MHRNIEDSDMKDVLDGFQNDKNNIVVDGEPPPPTSPTLSPANLRFDRLSATEKTNLADDSKEKKESSRIPNNNRRKRRLGDDCLQQISDGARKTLEIKNNANMQQTTNADEQEEERKRKRIQEEEDEKFARSIQLQLDNQHISSTQSRTSSDQLIAQSIAIEEQQNSFPHCLKQLASRFLRQSTNGGGSNSSSPLLFDQQQTNSQQQQFPNSASQSPFLQQQTQQTQQTQQQPPSPMLQQQTVPSSPFSFRFGCTNSSQQTQQNQQQQQQQPFQFRQTSSPQTQPQTTQQSSPQLRFATNSPIPSSPSSISSNISSTSTTTTSSSTTTNTTFPQWVPPVQSQATASLFSFFFGRNRPNLDLLRLTFLNPNRDFNASDYEMLLRLDETVESCKGLAPSILEKLECYIQTDAHDGVQCCICLCELDVGESVKSLPCGHKFHAGCIDKWLSMNGTCPIDKYEIFK